MGGLLVSLTAASGSDSAQSMLQPEPPASLSAGLFGRTTACLTDHQPETRSGVHSESPGLLARASGPVSVLGYFNLHVWHQLFYQYTEYRNKKLRRINSEHSIVHH